MLGLVGKLLLPRVERWWWLGLGWPESTAASSAAAAGVRVRSGSVLQGVWRGVVQGHRGEEGRAGRQGERWRGAVARARRPHSVPLSGRKTTEEGPGGLGRLLAGRPAAAGLRRGGEAQVSFSPLFCFLF